MARPPHMSPHNGSGDSNLADKGLPTESHTTQSPAGKVSDRGDLNEGDHVADTRSRNTHGHHRSVRACRPASQIIGASVELVGAALIGFVLSALLLLVLSRTNFPAFGNSQFTRALTTLGQIGALCLSSVAVWWSRIAQRNFRAQTYGKEDIGEDNSTTAGYFGHITQWLRRHEWAPKALGAMGAATLVTTTLGIPLSATRLYLHGVSVDQAFRTEFLTRLTDTTKLEDMAYADLPSFYPSGWFWFGGRFASFINQPAWLAFKPWAIISLSIAAAVATVLWTHLQRTDRGIVIATISTTIIIAYGAPEPYGAVVAIFIPPLLLLGWHAINPAHHNRGRAATLATVVLVGVSASFYTLYAGVIAVSLCLMAVVAVVGRIRRRGQDTTVSQSKNSSPDSNSSIHRPTQQSSAADNSPAHSMSENKTSHNRVFGSPSVTNVSASGEQGRQFFPVWLPLLRLFVIGTGATAIASVVWAPYFKAVLQLPHASQGTATHYLPESSATLLLPMFRTDIVGLLCLVGLVWIVIRVRSSRRAQALSLGVLACYLWTILSMVAVLGGTTLVGFRMELPLILLLSTAGGFASFEMAQYVLSRMQSGSRDISTIRTGTIRVAITLVCTLLGFSFIQSIPGIQRNEIQLAYTDTDGYGERADRFPAGYEAYYPELDKRILEQVAVSRHTTPDKLKRSDIVVLTAEEGLLAFHPYRAFQAISSHYANPLGEYSKRNTTIEKWATTSSSHDLAQYMDSSPWRGPDVLVLRVIDGTYQLKMSEDIYPNDPNVRRYITEFDARLFEQPYFSIDHFGPFAIIVRIPTRN